MAPAFPPQITRVSGRRFVAHLIDASDYRQRFGDRWGRTYVIAD